MLNNFMNIEIMPNKNVMESICNDMNIQNNFDNEIFFQYAWLIFYKYKIFVIVKLNFRKNERDI